MNFAQLFGRLHPLVLHFPVALIVLAAVVETVRLKWDRPALAQLVPFLLAIGALGALAASVTGWVFAHDFFPAPSDAWMLTWYRWLGIATTVLAGIAAWIARRHAYAARSRDRWLRHAAVWLTAIILTVTAHLGALMVWGADYFNPTT